MKKTRKHSGRGRPVAEDHASYIMKRIGHKVHGKRTKPATPEQTATHLENMQREFGVGVLTPTEERLLAQLRGKRIPPAPPYAGARRAA